MNEGADRGSEYDTESLEARGWQLLDRKQYAEAIGVFRQVFAREAENLAAYQGTIAALRKKRDFTGAAALLDQALAAHPTHPGILSERAWLYLEQKQYSEAIGAFDAVIATGQCDEGIYLWKISLLRSQREFEKAKQSIADAERRFPDSPRLRNECAWLHFYQMQYDEALDGFVAILRENPTDASALQGRIASLRLQGNYSEATELANRALDLPSKSPGIYSERGWISFEQGRYEDAEADFKRALALIPDDPQAHIHLAWSLVRQGTDADLARATKGCRQALSLDPNLAEAFGCLGNIAFKRGRIREAEAHFLRSLQANPKRGHYADLGALYIQMGRYPEARKQLKRALAINPDDAYAHMEMGDLFLQTEKIKEAIREFRVATVIEPKNPEATKALAIALMASDKPIDAEKVLRGAIRLMDESQRWDLHLTLCRLLARIGDDTNDLQFYEEALKEVSTTIRLKPNHPAPHFHAGIVRFKLEDYRGALKSFARCLAEDPHHLEAELNARRLRSLIRNEKARSRASLWASGFLAFVFLIQLIAIWVLRFATDQITDTMLTLLVPILLGLMVVAVLLPWLSRIKMTGLEAELSEPPPKESLPAGPKGQIGFGNASPKPI